MSLQDIMRLLRTRWVTIVVTLLAATIVAIAATLMTTPMYEASTRLYVSTSAGSSVTDMYQGNRLSQERVLSYTQLLTGETLAQRTIDKLGLSMSAEQLRHNVKATARADTVLINVNVLDDSPVRARDLANTLSDEFVSLVRELETPENGARPDARVVVEQRASIPSEPVVPKKTRNIAVGLALGALLGIAFALLRDVLDSTAKDDSSLEEITGVGIVGKIPLDKQRRRQVAISFATDHSTSAEAFRKLRTNLQFLAVDSPPRMIIVTSSVPSEGKSTTAINIALALAEADHTVVLVDGDMRRPSLHKYLDLVGPVGFSTVLSGTADLDDALQTTRFAGLTVLTSGAIPPNPSELLGSQTAKKLLIDLRAKFDYVIVDSTPLLAVTDAAILAASSDCVLLIARYGHTRRDQVAHAVDSLKGVAAPLLGAVFTMIPTRSSTYYKYAYNYDSDGEHLTKRGQRFNREFRANARRAANSASSDSD